MDNPQFSTLTLTPPVYYNIPTVYYFDLYIKPISAVIGLPIVLTAFGCSALMLLYFVSMAAYKSAREATNFNNVNLEEVNNLLDLWVMFAIVIYLLFTPLLVVWYAQVFQYKLSVFVPLVLIAVNLFLLPHVYTWYCGGVFIVFLRGAAPTTLIVYEYILDTINYVSFNLRMNLQFSRVVIIIITGFTFYLVWDEIIWPVDGFLTKANKMWCFISHTILRGFQILAEIGHFLIIFSMQIAILLIMLIWLFHFLYVTIVKWWHNKP